MPPTLLVVGATGNTGRGVVKTLSRLLDTKTAFSGYRVLALTRSAKGTVAQGFAELPNVEVKEKNWVEITADWLRQNEVERIFLASPVRPSQFAEESTFYLAALDAGVQYVVRISTTAPNVRPDCPAYYPRSHWAIEALLSSPEFDRLKWTSLQPNAFSPLWLYTAAEFVKNFRETGKQDTLSLMASKDELVGIIDPDEIGVIAAYLITDDNFVAHHKARYVLNGPEDITGQQIVQMVEQAIGTKVENVRYKDMSIVDGMAARAKELPNIILSIKRAPEPIWEGKCPASTTSQEILQLGLLKRTPAESFNDLLK